MRDMEPFLSSSVWDCYATKVRVRLPITTNRQNPEAEIGEKGKRSLFKCCTNLGEWQALVYPLWKPKGKPSPPQLDQNPGGVQSSFSHSKYPPLTDTGSCWVVIPAGLKLSPQKLNVGSALPLAMWLPGPEGPANVPSSTFVRWARASPFFPLSLYVCFPCKTDFPAQICTCSRIFCPPTDPFFSPD